MEVLCFDDQKDVFLTWNLKLLISYSSVNTFDSSAWHHYRFDLQARFVLFTVTWEIHLGQKMTFSKTIFYATYLNNSCYQQDNNQIW